MQQELLGSTDLMTKILVDGEGFDFEPRFVNEDEFEDDDLAF